MSRTTRRVAPFAAIAVALTITACSEGETPSPDNPTSSQAAATPEVLDRPEQQQVDAATAQSALPKVTDLPGEGWAPNTLVKNTSPTTYEPAICADVEFDSDAAKTFEDEHRKVHEEARYLRSLSGGSEITATYVSSHDQPFPTSLLDAAGEHVTDCETYTRSSNGFSSTRHVKAISTPQIGDRSFGLRVSGDSGSYTDRLYVRSGHNLIIVMVLTSEDTYDGKRMSGYAQDILDKLKKSS